VSLGVPGTNGSMTSVRREIRQFIVQNFLFGQGQEWSDGTSFLESGIIDSTGVLELVAHLEETYDVKVNDDELIPDNLDSIDAIVAYLARKGAASEQDA
jgi:acyl carrier protein